MWSACPRTATPRRPSSSHALYLLPPSPPPRQPTLNLFTTHTLFFSISIYLSMNLSLRKPVPAATHNTQLTSNSRNGSDHLVRGVDLTTADTSASASALSTSATAQQLKTHFSLSLSVSLPPKLSTRHLEQHVMLNVLFISDTVIVVVAAISQNITHSVLQTTKQKILRLNYIYKYINMHTYNIKTKKMKIVIKNYLKAGCMQRIVHCSLIYCYSSEYIVCFILLYNINKTKTKNNNGRT